MSDITPTPEDVEAARQFVKRVKSDGMTIREVAQFRAEARQAGAAERDREWRKFAVGGLILEVSTPPPSHADRMGDAK